MRLTMSVLKTLTSIALAIFPRNGSTKERAIKVHSRIEGTIEEIDPLQRLITIRKAREQTTRRIFQVPAQCKITHHGEVVRFEHMNLFDHVWVVFNKGQKEDTLVALDVEIVS